MAQKRKSRANTTTIHRITATDDASKKPTTTQSTGKVSSLKKSAISAKTQTVKKKPGVLYAVTGYFKGAWHELKLVRWPTRSATWAMTAAVLLFTLVFVALILLLDTGFN